MPFVVVVLRRLWPTTRLQVKVLVTAGTDRKKSNLVVDCPLVFSVSVFMTAVFDCDMLGITVRYRTVLTFSVTDSGKLLIR